MVSKYIVLTTMSVICSLLVVYYLQFKLNILKFHIETVKNQTDRSVHHFLITEKYKSLNLSFHCNSNESYQFDINVYWTVLAGRRDRLQLQEKYWHILKHQGLITEVHLWDFTYRNRNQKEAEHNKQWIYNKSKQYSYIRVFSKPGFLWSTYYKHYANYQTNDSVILKVDDDIIWVNSSEFRCFVKFVHESKNVFLASANVVNNELIAFFQQSLGSFPKYLLNLPYPEGGEPGKLSSNAAFGYKLHKYFISHKSDFFKKNIIQFSERLNINFIAFRSENAKEINRYAYFDRKFKGAIDEVGLTRYAIQYFKKFEVAYMRFVVAHASFGRQYVQNSKIVAKILELYKK